MKCNSQLATIALGGTTFANPPTTGEPPWQQWVTPDTGHLPRLPHFEIEPATIFQPSLFFSHTRMNFSEMLDLGPS